MIQPYPNFIGGSNQTQSVIGDAEDTINWYFEPARSAGSTSAGYLLPTPGYKVKWTTSDIAGRALFAGVFNVPAVQTNRIFAVIGSDFRELFADGTSVSRGTVAVNSNPATICTNGDGGSQLFITSGDVGYCFNLTTNTLTTVIASGATVGGQAYGYFISFNIANSQIRLSALFDGTTWDPTQFLQRSIGADPWQSMLVSSYGQICLPGSKTGEFLYNTGTFPFPFAPDPSGLFAEGIAATFSLCEAGGSLCWLSTTANGGYQVVRATGFTPTPITSPAVSYALSRYNRVDDAIGQTYEEAGHSFYLLTLPSAGITWAYDFTTNQWHKRQTWIAERNMYVDEHAVWHAFAFNAHYMADRTTGTIYQMDVSFETDVDSRPIRRLRQAPAVERQNMVMFFPLFEVIADVGYGTETGAASDPQIVAQFSDDGGQTWGNERQASMGKVGQFGTRMTWWNTGSARKRVNRIVCIDSVPRRIVDASLKTSAGREAA
jgi:hypothetical protein